MKERMITRTIKNTAALLKVYDLDTDEITETWLDITGNVANDDDLLKACENRLKSGIKNYKLLKIIDKLVTEKLYAMPENIFMLYAQEIPARNIKEEEEEV